MSNPHKYAFMLSKIFLRKVYYQLFLYIFFHLLEIYLTFLIEFSCIQHILSKYKNLWKFFKCFVNIHVHIYMREKLNLQQTLGILLRQDKNCLASVRIYKSYSKYFGKKCNIHSFGWQCWHLGFNVFLCVNIKNCIFSLK